MNTQNLGYEPVCHSVPSPELMLDLKGLFGARLERAGAEGALPTA